MVKLRIRIQEFPFWDTQKNRKKLLLIFNFKSRSIWHHRKWPWMSLSCRGSCANTKPLCFNRFSCFLSFTSIFCMFLRALFATFTVLSSLFCIYVQIIITIRRRRWSPCLFHSLETLGLQGHFPETKLNPPAFSLF